MAISASQNLSGVLLASSVSPVLYTVPASRYAKITLSAGGSVGQVLSGSAGPGAQTGITLAGKLVLSSLNPSGTMQTAFSKSAGVYGLSLVSTGLSVDSFHANDPSLGYFISAGCSGGRTLASVVAALNARLTSFYGAPANAVTIVNPADGALVITGGGTQIDFVSMALGSVNTSATESAKTDVLVDGGGQTFASKTSTFTLAAGQTLQAVNGSSTQATQYDLSVVEFSN